MMQDDEQCETTHEKTTDWFYSSGGKLLARLLTCVRMFCFGYDVQGIFVFGFFMWNILKMNTKNKTVAMFESSWQQISFDV